MDLKVGSLQTFLLSRVQAINLVKAAMAHAARAKLARGRDLSLLS
jgi:hypothetical protein